MQSSNPPIYQEEKEVTLKDIILLVQEYFYELKANYKLILYIIAPFAVYFSLKNMLSDLVYPSRLTFLVTDDKDQSYGDVTKILGSFGMPTGQQDESALEKVLQLFRSRQIVENTIFQKSKINGKVDFVANHMIDAYGWDRLIGPYKSYGIFSPYWAKKIESVENFRYAHGNVDSFNITENLALKVLYERIVGNKDEGIDPLVGSTIDEKSGIMSITLKTVDEELTAEMLISLYNQLSQYYIDKTIEKQVKIFNIATYKKDSIQAELNYADKALAEFEDRNRALVWVTGELTRTRLQRKARFLEILYGESMKQAEMSDFSLRNKTPYVQVIDEPARPILPSKPPWTSGLILGIAIGTVLGAGFIIVRKVIRDSLAT